MLFATSTQIVSCARPVSPLSGNNCKKGRPEKPRPAPIEFGLRPRASLAWPYLALGLSRETRRVATGGPFRAHRLYVLFIAQLCECLLVVVDFDAIDDPVLPFRAKLYVDGDTNLYAGANLHRLLRFCHSV